MFGIGDFFKKIQGAYAKEILARTVIKESIQKHTGIEVAIEAILFKGNSVILEGLSPSARTALYIKKAAVLKDVSAAGLGRAVLDIR